MELLFAALGLAIAIEGMLYALFPDGMRNMMAQIMEMPSRTLRAAGLAAAVVGVVIAWMARLG
ncbi:DUF2065 domain-containing protein [Magnetospira sp. QH-2]|uniref:DUF2065 domain-containing protein n=1 Tax=Magnetospira sp. (strain QH-2) TaxID=1288970 RepID=UPI0003E81B65|nr:DUF2065 domain-containing protein [Magnetospira sp. QH-2]CCQ73484.1 Conserved protein of unknown function [Magnetospira sp. QH-2]